MHSDRGEHERQLARARAVRRHEHRLSRRARPPRAVGGRPGSGRAEGGRGGSGGRAETRVETQKPREFLKLSVRTRETRLDSSRKISPSQLLDSTRVGESATQRGLEWPEIA